ncbi:MAG: hypothetical protein O7B81_11795, partial [Gammaproteobacteria bacterium]|nr:hypothetical protein [Gammaproteobacteria bacterium]
GELVVVSGQFLIDSESSFAGASLRMSAGLGSGEIISGDREHTQDHAEGGGPPFDFEAPDPSP